MDSKQPGAGSVTGSAFLFTLRNPHGIPPTHYPSTGEYAEVAWGPNLTVFFYGGIGLNSDTRWRACLDDGVFKDTTGKGYATLVGGHGGGWTPSEVLVFTV